MFHKSQRLLLQATNYLIVISIFIQMVFVTETYAKWGIYKLEDGISYQNEGRYPEAITEYYQVIEEVPQNIYAFKFFKHRHRARFLILNIAFSWVDK